MKSIRRCAMRLLTCVLCAIALTSVLSLAPATPHGMLQPDVAQAATTNAKAKAAYKKTLKKIVKSTPSHDPGAYYKFANVYGTSTVEMLCVTRVNSGSGCSLRIYTYSGGKVKLMLNTTIYGDMSYSFYRKTKGFGMRCAGHGGESYYWYKASGGKFKLVASKGRQAVAGGALEDGPWSYGGIGDKEIAKATFVQRVKNISKGAKVKLSGHYEWSWMSK